MHGTGDPILELLVVLAAAAVGAALFERLRLPAIVGFLIAGTVAGPGGLGLIPDSERVRTLAEFGVAFLLFEIGLELPLEELRRSWRRTLLAGLLQVSITIAAMGVLGVGLGLSIEVAIVVGMLISLSSTALVMRILGQIGQVDSPHGRLSLGILLFQDLCIVPFLLAIPILSGEVPRDFVPMARAIGTKFAALAGLYAVSRFVLPWVLARVAHLRSPDIFSVFAFLVAIGMAVAAEHLGLGLAVGAFIAGLVLSASPYAQQLFAEVAPLRGVLLGVFFTSIGMLLVPAEAIGEIVGVAIYVGGVLVFKSLVIVVIVAGILREGLRTGVQTGLALAQTGEFSFVVAAMATDANLLPPDVGQIFVAGSVLTLLATPFVIRGSARVAALVVRGGAPAPASEDEAIADHVVVVGFGLAGRSLASVLKSLSIPYKAVDGNPRTVERWRSHGEPIIFGDSARPAILEHLGVQRARLVSIAINDPEATRATIEVARSLAPDVEIVARAQFMDDLDALFQQGASQVVAEEFESTIDLMSKVLRSCGVTQASIAHFAEELRDEGYELLRGPVSLGIDPWLTDTLQEVDAEWIEVPATAPPERSIHDLDVRARTGASILAVRRDDGLTTNPDPEFSIRPGDSLLILISADELPALRTLLSGDSA